MDSNLIWKSDLEKYKFHLYKYIYVLISGDNYLQDYDYHNFNEEQYIKLFNDFAKKTHNSKYKIFKFNFNSNGQLHSDYDVNQNCYIPAIKFEDNGYTLLCIYFFDGKIADINHPVYFRGYIDEEDESVCCYDYYMYNICYYSSKRIEEKQPVRFNIYCEKIEPDSESESDSDTDYDSRMLIKYSYEGEYKYENIDYIFINAYNDVFTMDIDDNVPIISNIAFDRICSHYNPEHILYEKMLLDIFNKDMLGKIFTQDYNIMKHNCL